MSMFFLISGTQSRVLSLQRNFLDPGYKIS
jgi:hypothetical protein